MDMIAEKRRKAYCLHVQVNQEGVFIIPILNFILQTPNYETPRFSV